MLQKCLKLDELKTIDQTCKMTCDACYKNQNTPINPLMPKLLFCVKKNCRTPSSPIMNFEPLSHLADKSKQTIKVFKQKVEALRKGKQTNCFLFFSIDAECKKKLHILWQFYFL